MRRGIRLGVAALALGTAVLAAGPVAVRAQEGRIVVGSKNFTESAILGEIMTQLLRERTGLEVEHRQNLGGTLVCFQAIRSGQIDLYPEYTGTGWAIILEEPERIDDRLRAFTRVQAEFRKRYDLEWLQPFGLNNTYALAMASDRAEELGVTKISDLVDVGPELKAGFSIEFMNRQDGWPGLSEYYGLQLGEVRALEHGLAYQAVTEGDIDLIDAYSTDGKLIRFDLSVLEDDGGFFPPYNAAPVVRRADAGGPPGGARRARGARVPDPQRRDHRDERRGGIGWRGSGDRGTRLPGREGPDRSERGERREADGPERPGQLPRVLRVALARDGSAHAGAHRAHADLGAARRAARGAGGHLADPPQARGAARAGCGRGDTDRAEPGAARVHDRRARARPFRALGNRRALPVRDPADPQEHAYGDPRRGPACWSTPRAGWG